MTTAIDTLFYYAQDSLVRPLLVSNAEYANAQHCANHQEKRLRDMLSDEARQCLDALLDERNLLRFFEDEALFRAGFQTAMELGR